jgi:hypothetical protein
MREGYFILNVSSLFIFRMKIMAMIKDKILLK